MSSASRKTSPNLVQAFSNGDALQKAEREILLSSLRFVHDRLAPAEKDVRTLYEHAKWVKGEIREVLEAYDDQNRIEEIGDVIMVSFRLSCFLHPERSAEEILAQYESHPTFRRYVREIGVGGLEKMREKFTGRYSFLDDPEAFRGIFEDGAGERKWQQEIIGRMFAAEKSREKGRKYSLPFPSETPVAPEASSRFAKAAGREATELEAALSSWFFERLENVRKEDADVLFDTFVRNGRLTDERFFRMVFLDLVATGDAAGAFGRLVFLVGTEEEREAVVPIVLPESDVIFRTLFLSDDDPLSERSERLCYRETFEAYRLFLEAGFGRVEAFEHARGLVGIWRVFLDAEAPHDLVEAIESIRTGERFRSESDPHRKFVIVQAEIHAFRKRGGTYGKCDEFGRRVEKTLGNYLRTAPEAR